MSQNTKNKMWMSWMTRLFRVTCADTSPLISELMDHDLPWRKRWRLKFHLMICGVCNIYKQQLEVIHALAQKLGHEETPSQQEVVLSEQAKTKIKNNLKQSS